MKKLLTAIVAAVVAVSTSAQALPADTVASAAPQPRQSVGLVLSGGGAKGIAHIGVIQALEDNDIPIDYITGTSMGAIVGGLYAAGYTPQEMLDLILSDGFSYWSTGQIEPSQNYYFNKPKPSPTMFSLPIKMKGEAADSVPASLISGLPMSFAFMDLFSAYTAQCSGDFDKLFVPYRSVASNVVAHRKYVWSRGSLGDAVRTSMTFPIVFQPIAVNDTLLYDGGIYDNFPLDVMRTTFAPSFMLGINVASSDDGPNTSLMDQLSSLVVQDNTWSLPDDEGIYMRVKLDQFSLLDFPQARAIYKVGYDKAMSMMDSIKSRVTSRTPAEARALRRNTFKSLTPHVRFDRVNVTGATEAQNKYIEYLFHSPHDGDTIGIADARDAYYRAISTDKVAMLLPRADYNDSTGLFTLNLKAAMKSRYRASVGGYITSSSNSFLYASLGYSSLNFRSVEASVDAWIGQSVMAGEFQGRLFVPTAVPSSLGLQIVASRRRYYENDHLFFSHEIPTYIINSEYFARLKWDIAASRSGVVRVGVGYGILRDSYFRDNAAVSFDDGRLHSRYNLGQASVSATFSTLDAYDFPRSGYYVKGSAVGVLGRNSTETGIDDLGSIKTDMKWIQGEVTARYYPSIGSHFALGLELDALLSTRKVLPTYAATMVGQPRFAPTPASNNAFRTQYGSSNFVAAGIVPIVKFTQSLDFRIGGYTFMDMRQLERDGQAVRYKSFGNTKFHWYGEADVVYHFPFGSLAAYANWADAPGDKWNVGISLGVFILPPKFLR